MRPVYGRGPWTDGIPTSRIPTYPGLRGALDVEVAIIGGGLTGCATAYACAAAGISVALFEGDRIGRQATAALPGWISAEPSRSFAATDAAMGRRAARHAWQAWRRAALDVEALVRRLGLKVQLEPRDAVLVARSDDEAVRLAREHKLRQAAGIDASLVVARSLAPLIGFPATAGLRSHHHATVQPYRTALGLAAAAADRGARIFERSPVARTAFTHDAATLSVNGRRVTCARVVVATGAPGSLFKPLARHLDARTSFLVLTEPVPAKLRAGLGSRQQLLCDLAEPAHRIAWVDDRLLVMGADGPAVPVRSRDQVLVQRTGQLMYELSTFYPDISGLQPAYGWDVPCGGTTTGLPIVGPHRNYPHHLFAFGGGSSVTAAYLASRILLRHHRGERQAADEVFGFGR
jgi:glycine/D-amino acid oxidase-like deaminating enzyme